MDRAPDPATVEVVCARPERQCLKVLPLTDGLTALEAVQRSGLLAEFPEIGARELDLGVFGRRVPPSQLLRAGDRVEIYRPLPDDPKERRRRLAAEGGARRARRGR